MNGDRAMGGFVFLKIHLNVKLRVLENGRCDATRGPEEFTLQHKLMSLKSKNLSLLHLGIYFHEHAGSNHREELSLIPWLLCC
jgi:hypothetical protein